MIAERQYLKEALYDWIAAVAAGNGGTDEVIFDNEKGVRPKPPFIAVQFIGGRRPGFPSRTRVDPATGEQRLYAPSEKTVSLHGIGEGSFDLLQTICDSIYIGKYSSLLRQRNLVVNKITDVTELGAELDTEWENRAVFDIRVSFIRVITNTPGWIEHAGIASDDHPSFPPVEI
jgi:hypothetical protein